MKKSYVRPVMQCEEFAANEYVAACGDSGKTYIFECNAPAGTLYYYDERGVAEGLGAFEPGSGAEHEAASTEEFKKGFIDYNKNRVEDDGEAVIVWLEYRKGLFGSYLADYHATTKLDINSWETAKS